MTHEHPPLTTDHVKLVLGGKVSHVFFVSCGCNSVVQEKGGGGGGGGVILGHNCTLKFNKEKISSCSKSATVANLVSIEAIARLIYIYAKQIFASYCTKSCLRAQKYQNFSGGHAPRPRGVGNN